MRTHRFIATLLAGLACAAALAGPIDPPAGPVTSTMKPLDVVEPRIPIGPATTPGDNDASPSLYKITQPGSYYLLGNVQGVSGKIGVEIAASNVTIDLAGFTLQGVNGSNSGILVTSLQSGITIRNGTVNGWGESGIDATKSSAARIESVTATNNGGTGITTSNLAVITGCMARQNAFTGISAGSAVTIRDCAADDNGTSGFWLGSAATLNGCTARNNNAYGFELNDIASANNCIATHNKATGFIAGYGSNYSSCTSAYNTIDGFWCNFGSMATNCSAYQNGRDGFYVSCGSVTNSQATMNQRDGIRLDVGNSTATGNTCFQNGLGNSGAGIRAVGASCRIDSNQVVSNAFGIHAAPDCMVVRNTARGNTTNYSFPVGSEYGQIITNPGSGFSSTNPWANFAY